MQIAFEPEAGRSPRPNDTLSTTFPLKPLHPK